MTEVTVKFDKIPVNDSELSEEGSVYEEHAMSSTYYRHEAV